MCGQANDCRIKTKITIGSQSVGRWRCRFEPCWVAPKLNIGRRFLIFKYDSYNLCGRNSTIFDLHMLRIMNCEVFCQMMSYPIVYFNDLFIILNEQNERKGIAYLSGSHCIFLDDLRHH